MNFQIKILTLYKIIMSNVCTHIECEEETKQGGWKYCAYHQNGGELGNGGLFDQYQIIEQDFIDFIKIIPIDEEEHLKVYSPVLKDIIIRCCVQIETFFKEWAKYSISNNSEISLYSKYMRLKGGKLRKEREWTFGDYYYFKSEFDRHKIFIRPMNQNLVPFETWESESKPPCSSSAFVMALARLCRVRAMYWACSRGFCICCYWSK